MIQSTPAYKVLLLASVMGAAKSAKLEQTSDRFYKAKVGRFTESFGKAPGRTPAFWDSKTACQRPLPATLGYKPAE